MVQPLFRRRIHRGLNSISPCRTAGADFASPNRAGRRDAKELLPGRGTRNWAIAYAVRPAGMVPPLARGSEASQPLHRSFGWSGTFGPADQANSGRHRRPRPDPAETMTIRKRSGLFGNGQLARFGVSRYLLFSLRSNFALPDCVCWKIPRCLIHFSEALRVSANLMTTNAEPATDQVAVMPRQLYPDLFPYFRQ
jgi:hypothetical protein